MVVNESRRVDLENCMRDIKMHQLVINQFVTEIEKLGGNVSVPGFFSHPLTVVARLMSFQIFSPMSSRLR